MQKFANRFVILRLNNISKHFGGTAALKGVSLHLAAGEVLGLVGENGAGKSTLIKILAGVHQPDDGLIEWQGKVACFRSPLQALQAGIATIHQELACFEKLTVAENLLLGSTWPRRAWGGLNWDHLNRLAQAQLDAFQLTIDPAALFHSLSPAQRQEIAIVRAISRNARLIILDEPTASLTDPEVRRLHSHLARLRQAGVAILYVSHRLEEILSLTNRILVLRDGAAVAEFPTSEASIERIVREMVGRTLAETPARESRLPGEPVLELHNLSHPPLFNDISFALHRSEIVGLAGLVGAGRSELARSIAGLYPPLSGFINLHKKPWFPRNPRAARAAGLVYIPEERKRQGLVLEHSTRSAISIGFLSTLGRFGWIRRPREIASVQRAVTAFAVKAKNLEQPVGSLSGGNQQKALLARCLAGGPEIILLDEPTRGVDVAAKQEIYHLIHQAAQAGKAILLISSDLPEILAMSDRILVMHRGAIHSQFSSEEATQEKILMAASGFAASPPSLHNSKNPHAL